MISSSSESLAPRAAAAPRGPVALAIQGARELAERRLLIRYLVSGDLKRTHSDTAFGQLWWILDPLLQMAVYIVLVQIIFRRQIPDYPLFLFAAVLPWKWFTTTLSDSTQSISSRQSLIRQLQFPKLVLPTAAVTAGTVSFGIGLFALALVYLFYLDRLSPWVLLLPVVAVVQYVFTLALGILLSVANAFYRDVQNVMRHVLRLWFYLSPALYSLENLRERSETGYSLLLFNPFTHLFESYRAITWGTSAPDWLGLLAVLLASFVLLAVSISIFKRAEPAFARIL
jgi:ABC-type polysaccharide/polyol phosphate export permease